MKKLMFAAAVAAGLVAFGDGIESANTVGYATKNVVAGKYYLIGVQFNDASSVTKGTIDMNDLIKLSSEFTPGTYESDFSGAPEIQVLNAAGTGYDMYYYISDATDDNDVALGYNCWADIDGYQLKDADKLALGKGFWFKASVSGEISTAGEVISESNVVQQFPANQFSIMSNPFPVDFSLANVTTTGITPGTYDADFVGASEIQVLNSSASGYDMYYYISDATDAEDTPVGYNCWADIDGYILNGTQVGAGAAFWIKGNAAGSLGFSR